MLALWASRSTEILLASGVEDVVLIDSRGTLHAGRGDLEGMKRELAEAVAAAVVRAQ